LRNTHCLLFLKKEKSIQKKSESESKRNTFPNPTITLHINRASKVVKIAITPYEIKQHRKEKIKTCFRPYLSLKNPLNGPLIKSFNQYNYLNKKIEINVKRYLPN